MSSANGPTLFPSLSNPNPFKRKKINIRFKIAFYTKWGQNLMISGSDVSFGNWDVKKGLVMSPYHEGEFLIWHAYVSVPEGFDLDYNYCLVDENLDVIKWDSFGKRYLTIPSGLSDGSFVDVLDTWQEGASPEIIYSSSAFKDVVFKDSEQNLQEDDVNDPFPVFSFPNEVINSKDLILLRLKVNCPRLKKGQKVFLSGNCDEFGNWNENSAFELKKEKNNNWQADVAIRKSNFPIKYRYFIKNEKNEVIKEVGLDLELDIDASSHKTSIMIIISNGYFRSELWRGGGLAIPVFSIRSQQCVGCGEFLDLKPLVDLTARCGMRLIQVLPVNDTSVHDTWWDSYPYSSLSVFALHPLYVRLESMAEDIPDDIKDEINQARISLNLKAVDYEETIKTKLNIAKKIFFLKKSSVFNSKEYLSFFEENKEWLEPYAAFCFLKFFFETSDHSQWGVFSTFSQKNLQKLIDPTSDHYNTISFHYFLQYHLYLQLKEVGDYAKSKRVILKGDLPIGVDKHSVDTWVNPTLFRMNFSTGAPPDDFSLEGQNWGFPTYNWQEMEKDNYHWWRARLVQLSKFFTAYRIDHILGFFRIWELPGNCTAGILGKFRPSIPLSAEEFENEGVWDFNRLCDPYIRPNIINETFGKLSNEFAATFFNQYETNKYQFKEEFDTEKKIVAYFESKKKKNTDQMDEENKQNLKNILSIYQNVVLIRDTEKERNFFPRFNLELTSSFKELDDNSKRVLKKLYHDYYFARQEDMWRKNALKTLPVLLNASEMLTCGEDLGLIPSCVPPVMMELGLLGLRIQRMPSEEGKDFADPSTYDYMTVCAPSCHDTSTLRAWWEEDLTRRQKYFQLFFCGVARDAPDTCTPEIAHAILQQHFDSPSVFSIIPIQDLFALKRGYADRPAKEETINDPTNPKHYWRFRLHVSVETLLEDSEFISAIQSLLINSGRVTPVDLHQV